ncbi:MAG: hypothetical protein HY204_05270 [Nitrospirae bacterium]|nr:hypothetical protein [Nitrospirota bacterium]
MTQRMTVVFWVAMTIGFLNADRALAQAYRNAVGVPPVEVYQSMLNFADRKEYAKVMGSLTVLSPIVNHIGTKFKDNPSKGIKKAVDKGDPDEILLSVQALIVLDVKDLLDEALQQAAASPDGSKTLLKIARLNYELLSPYAQKKDFAADTKIKKTFTELFRTLGSEVDSEQIRRFTADIISNLSELFPSKAS